MIWTTHQFYLFIRIHASFKNGKKRKGYVLDVSGTAAAYSLPKHGATTGIFRTKYRHK